MKLGSRRQFLGATAIAVMCLLSAAVVAGQAGATQTAPTARVPMVEDFFKTVTLLKGIPVDTFFEAMGMFASSMGEDCTFCHVSKAYFDKSLFAEQTPRIARARQMIAMVTTINKQFFGGRPRVTCFTCHHGDHSPVSDPDIALQYSEPNVDPNTRDLAPDITGTTADQVFDKYIKALGGADRLAKFTSFTAKGTYMGFDTALDEVPVELYVRAPNQQTMVVHFFNGGSTRTFDGRNGWVAGVDTPLPIVTLTGGNLDRARLEAMLWFPAGIKQAFSQWKVGRALIDGDEVQVVQGSEPDQAPANFYFNESGLLMRLVRWTQTPVGFVPTQIDFEDYRDVAGVKVPFRKKVSQTYMQMTMQLKEMQPNVAIDRARFAQPAPVPAP
jgi:hypothetical protein